LKRGGDPAEHRKSRQLQEDLDDADLIVSGTVTAVTVPPQAENVRALAAPPAGRPVSEHVPKWRQAVVQVDETQKVSHASSQVDLLFPASTDVRWYKAPKFYPGQKGVFVLHKTKIKTEEHHELRGLAPEESAEAEVYTALRPDDVQPLKQQGAIKAMIR